MGVPGTLAVVPFSVCEAGRFWRWSSRCWWGLEDQVKLASRSLHGAMHRSAVLSQLGLPFVSWFEKVEAPVLHDGISALKIRFLWKIIQLRAHAAWFLQQLLVNTMQFSFLLGFWLVGTHVFPSSDLPEHLHFKALEKTRVRARSSSKDAQPLTSHPSSEGCFQ